MSDWRITKNYSDLLAILRGFVHGNAPESFESPDWKWIVHNADIHGITGIVSWMTVQYQLADDPVLMNRARQMAKQIVALYVRRWEDARCLLRALDRENIDHIMLKGYVLRDCYPIPELRTYGDLDLVIRPEDRKRTDTWMRQQGYTAGTDWEPVYSYYKGPELYEFHTDIMEVDITDRADYRGYFRSVWDHVEHREGHTYVPAPEFHFLYLLAHIAKHISGSGAGLRMYLDLALFITQYGLNMDWNWISGELESIELTEFANIVLSAVEQWFQVASPIPLLPVSMEIMERFLAYTMEGGVFGQVSRNSGVVAIKQEMRNEKSVSRGVTLLHRLFPAAETIERRYTYLQNRHWLLPVAWLHRFFRTRNQWGAHAKQAKDILKADEEQVRKLEMICTEIGLGDPS